MLGTAGSAGDGEEKVLGEKLAPGAKAVAMGLEINY